MKPNKSINESIISKALNSLKRSKSSPLNALKHAYNNNTTPMKNDIITAFLKGGVDEYKFDLLFSFANNIESMGNNPFISSADLIYKSFKQYPFVGLKSRCNIPIIRSNKVADDAFDVDEITKIYEDNETELFEFQ
jgi:hypothetical protein